MSSLEAEYFRRLIQRTRRDDAALMARFGPVGVGDGASAELLRALAARWPLDRFDEINIAVEAPYNPRMKRALAFLGPVRVTQGGGGRVLSARNMRDVTRWILTIAGRDIDGLMLVRDPIGWCEIETVGGWRQ